MLRKDDRVFRTDAAAGGAALAAVVSLLDEDRLDLIDAIDAEQAEIDALHAVSAAAVVDHRIPAAGGVFRLRNADCGLRSGGQGRGGRLGQGRLDLHRRPKCRVVRWLQKPLDLLWLGRTANPFVEA